MFVSSVVLREVGFGLVFIGGFFVGFFFEYYSYVCNA